MYLITIYLFISSNEWLLFRYFYSDWSNMMQVKVPCSQDYGNTSFTINYNAVRFNIKVLKPVYSLMMINYKSYSKTTNQFILLYYSYHASNDKWSVGSVGSVTSHICNETRFRVRIQLIFQLGIGELVGIGLGISLATVLGSALIFAGGLQIYR